MSMSYDSVRTYPLTVTLTCHCDTVEFSEGAAEQRRREFVLEMRQWARMLGWEVDDEQMHS